MHPTQSISRSKSCPILQMWWKEPTICCIARIQHGLKVDFVPDICSRRPEAVPVPAHERSSTLMAVLACTSERLVLAMTSLQILYSSAILVTTGRISQGQSTSCRAVHKRLVYCKQTRRGFLRSSHLTDPWLLSWRLGEGVSSQIPGLHAAGTTD